MFVLLYNDQETVEVLGVYTSVIKANEARKSIKDSELEDDCPSYLVDIIEIDVDGPPETAMQKWNRQCLEGTK